MRYTVISDVNCPWTVKHKKQLKKGETSAYGVVVNIFRAAIGVRTRSAR